jgi:hypothetical protein
MAQKEPLAWKATLGREWNAKRDGNLPRDHACRRQQQCQAQLINKK